MEVRSQAECVGPITCEACGEPVGVRIHHYPTRKAPYNQPYWAAEYHRDPFWGEGPLAHYCGPRCYLEKNPRG